MDLFELVGRISIDGADRAERDIDRVTDSGEDAEKKVAINIISKYLFMSNHHQYSDKYNDHANDIVHR